MKSYSNPTIKAAFERVQRILGLKPEKGRRTATSTVRITDGLCVEVQEGSWTYKVDLPQKIGGTEQGPPPGILVRGALGSCLLMGYLMWASKMDIEVHNLEVEIQGDYDSGGQYATSSATPGYLEVRYEVRIDSPAPEAQVLAMIDQADKHSPLVDVFTRRQVLKRQVTFLQTA